MDEDPELQAFATKLFDLARAGDTETLRAYVEAGVPADLTNGKGDTLLMPAAYYGHAETVTMLVASGADPNRPNDRGQTPLAGAGFKKESAVVRALLDAGADPRAGQPSALDAARIFANDQFLRLFTQSGA
ncbi:ankyrin repeat domain-containing protein [Nonomuraea mesophila]|uniref:Ankyrin repeat domain-containing protein n=1 Tax=Nonomuraea mesophila TaxID=2530382 RepID=A0A4R5EQA3_9ACTN|nr:ankyrin repeat domain-containing protein [Nonomuraea mesophila]TDE36847.1 ankyrin repeat domain-containing protein [Nonomuraea mesophila]